MIGVVIPAHNEARRLARCLAAAGAAARHPALRGEPVRVVVVLDSCTDASPRIAARHGVETVAVQARNVGAARAAGADLLLRHGARWLAFTDADSRVASDWLVAQLSLGADAVCGTVAVDDWRGHPASVIETWRLRYHDADGHRHVHGANLGVSARAYRRAGGFPPLACEEDVALVARLTATGARIAWSAAPRVTTSARLDPRARGGFGDTLAAWAGRGLDSLRAEGGAAMIEPAPLADGAA
ncbi:glycosyltransferase [Burkholderia plantarii]|uniref:glycosyltransferase n=1 Tax=Burkholderia plantarii TaxID=41899 RepID=UPI0018DCDC1D|nr:glycosyltransferase [Burkholderia plantarii]MBI0328303.1 glycosyltransferase [Burkholderia plantarii]